MVPLVAFLPVKDTMTCDNSVDFDSVVNLEENFYRDSYHNAHEIGFEHTKLDGKQFGIQTGFQRFVLLGALKKFTQLVDEELQNNDDLPNKISDKMLKSINEILKLSQGFYSDGLIETSNTPADVESYEKQMKLIKSKAKILYSKLGYKSKFSDLESTCRSLSGDIPSTQINTGDENDMW